MTRTRRRRPAGNGTAPEEKAGRAVSAPSVAPFPDADQAQGPQWMRGTTLMIAITVDGQHWRRKPYLTLSAAQLAANRAAARGQKVEAALCSVQVLHTVDLFTEEAACL